MDLATIQAISTTANLVDIVIGFLLLKMWVKVAVIETKQRECCKN